MAISLSQLCENAEKSYSMRLVAGSGGMENTVRWVHIVEDSEVPDFLHGNGRRNRDGQRADGRDFVIAAHIGDIVLSGQIDEIHEQRAVVLFGDAQLRKMAARHANGRLVAEFAFEHGRKETADGGGAVFRIEKRHVEGESAVTTALKFRRHGGMGMGGIINVVIVDGTDSMAVKWR